MTFPRNKAMAHYHDCTACTRCDGTNEAPCTWARYIGEHPAHFNGTTHQECATSDHQGCAIPEQAS